jgi:para-aminobenzoate synthetase
MRVLLVDHYDSFTFNLAHLIAKATGAMPFVASHDQFTWEHVLEYAPDAIVLSPGPGDPANPADFGLSARILEKYAGPVLGVCLGMQGIVCAAGGRVGAAGLPVHGRTSRIRHSGDSLFNRIEPGFRAMRYHSLSAVRPLPPDLEEIATAEDDGAVMAIRHRSRPRWGVQFHPESFETEAGERLIGNFLRLARRSARVRYRQLRVMPDPEAAFIELSKGAKYAAWLDSSAVMPQTGRFSYIAWASQPNEPIDSWTGLISGWSGLRSERGDVPFPFQGGLVGYLAYELKEDFGFGPSWQSPFGKLRFFVADRVLALDLVNNAAWLISIRDDAWMDEAEAALRDLPHPGEPELRSAPIWEPRSDRAQYIDLIGKCQEFLARGQSYELCLTNEFGAPATCEAFVYYRSLRLVNPAPFSAFVRFPGLEIACSSPERFLKVTDAGEVESRPIKGTAKRNASSDTDLEGLRALARSTKDRAENAMIVDLVRSDLSRVCVPGTVHVAADRVVESYATVHQMVSVVRGQLLSGLCALDAVRAAFPGGSMTGAPKKRSIEILHNLEAGPRGIYSGAIGYLSVTGAADFNIVIRTAVFADGRVSAGAGGAITVLSNAAQEWQEVLLKFEPLSRAFVRRSENRAQHPERKSNISSAKS